MKLFEKQSKGYKGEENHKEYVQTWKPATVL